MSNKITNPVSPEQISAFQIRLWDLMAKKIDRYNGGDSTSVPKETAEELWKSVCFTLGIHPDSEPAAWEPLIQVDLDQAYQEGVRAIEKKIQEGKELWRVTWSGVPKIENTSLQDTLLSMGGFWDRYDYTFFAHQIACDVDYQLCHPLDDNQFGVDFVNEYLQRLMIENDMIRRFPVIQSIRLLERYCPDYRGLLINLYEPLVTNALGLTLVGGDARSLDITPAQCRHLFDLFSSLSPPEAALRMKDAAKQLGFQLALSQEEQKYLELEAAKLTPRVLSLLATGTLRGIFLSWHDQGDWD